MNKLLNMTAQLLILFFVFVNNGKQNLRAGKSYLSLEQVVKEFIVSQEKFLIGKENA